MRTGVTVSEGTIPFRGYRTWYRIVGDLGSSPSGKLPVLMLHGGPGLSHDLLEPLEDLARTGRPVVLYDQLGGGDSDRPDDPGLWSVELFLDELATVRRELGLRRTHLLGHSWGGLLAMEHALGDAGGLASLILIGAVVAGSMVFECRERFYEWLPPDLRDAIREHEAAGNFENPEYREAIDVFYHRYACRLDPWPAWMDRAMERINVQVNAAMWGAPGDGAGSHPLRTWDLRPRLGDIDVPTLVTAGRRDGMTLGQEAEIHDRIPGSELVYFEESSHYPFAEEPERYLTVLDDFLTRAEQRPTLVNP